MNKILGFLIIGLAICQTVPAQIYCGFSFGKAIHLPKPVYSESIKFKNELEIIEVKVEIDSRGYITSAKTILGNSDFSMISETAALNSRFRPSIPMMKVTGTLKYEFSASTKSIRVIDSINYDINELKKKAQIECRKTYKIDYRILLLINRLGQKQTRPNVDEQSFVINGKAKIGIKLKSLTSKNIKELKSLGVEIISRISSERAIVGQIPIEKIETLLELENIIYVFPFWIKPPPKPIV